MLLEPNVAAMSAAGMYLAPAVGALSTGWDRSTWISMVPADRFKSKRRVDKTE